MGISAKIKRDIMSELHNNEDPRTVAKKYGISRATAYNMRNELREEDSEASVVASSRIKPETFEIIKDAIDLQQATIPESVAVELKETVSSLESLQILEKDMHKIVHLALDKAAMLLNKPNLSIIDWQIITSTVADCHKSIFGKGNTTNNLIQGDMVGKKGDNLTMFQGRM